ncbi:MAG: cation-translocating P-type ATPase [Desulfobacterota bacterium]|nr:cation-translocating P-type ATPase [Thermodesulfobacteriota bacterium]MDW8002110.1 cation-translocating P-type ATPase [Deltaproteobacteria bacterium]
MAEAWHAMEVSDVIKKLKTDPLQGLSESEAKTRLEQYGYNELKREEKISPFDIFVRQFKNILIIILLVAIGLSALVGEFVDAGIIAVIVFFCALLGFFQEYRAEKALEALKKMLSPTITVLREGTEKEVPSREVVPGDILLLEAGDKVPADGRVIESYSLRCDEAPLTGESFPVGKETHALPEELAVGDRKNMVFAGTTVTYGRGKVIVTSTGMKTEFGKIAAELTGIRSEKTPLERRTEEIGKWFGIIALSICFIVGGVSVIRELVTSGKIDVPSIITILMFVISLAVAAVPESLPAIVTGALAIGMRQMAKRNALVRKMPAVETLGCTTVICSDKTGTLTKGEMTVRKIYSSGKTIEVTGSGYAPYGDLKVKDETDPPNDKSLELLLHAITLCNDADLYEAEGKWAIKGDPTEAALLVVAAKGGVNFKENRAKRPRVGEIPFSSERKRMTTIHLLDGRNRAAYMKGAPEVVLERCTSVLIDGELSKLDDAQRKKILSVNEDMAKEALRVLGVAYRDLGEDTNTDEETVEKDMVFLGLVGMIDPPREEAIEATKICQQVGIKPIMITGDHKLTALAIAKEIGIYKEGDIVLTGEELEKISEEELEKIVDKVTVYARVSPVDKLKIVKAWKKRGEIVAMTGDGVNDAPALKHADIGIAMGITGTEVAKEASDMVLTDDNFASIVKAIELGRWIYDNIKKYLTYLLRCNITEVAVIAGTVLIMGPEYLPLLPAAILYINLATDGLPALALGVAPPEPDVMKRPPRDPKESVFSWDVKAFILLALLIEIPFFYFLYFHELGDIAHARTEIFFLFIVIEIIIALNFRSMRFSIFKAPPHKWLILAIVWEIILITTLVHIPSVRDAFGILMPTMDDMKLILSFGFLVFLSMEVVKIIIRRKMRYYARTT